VALPAQTQRRTTPEALIAPEFRGRPVHDSVHAASTNDRLEAFACILSRSSSSALGAGQRPSRPQRERAEAVPGTGASEVGTPRHALDTFAIRWSRSS
jgi:hypothetical protein